MRHFIRYLLAFSIIIVVLGWQNRAEGAVLKVTIESKTVTAPGPDSLDILVENIGTIGQALSAFQLQVLLSGAAGVTFTGADEGTPTSTYVFDSNGSVLSFASLSAVEFIATDIYGPPPGFVTIGVGDVFRLARAYFDVSAVAPNGLRPVDFVLDVAPDGTQFYDDNIAAISYDDISFVSGGIDVQLDHTVLVPEPASASVSLVFGVVALLGVALRKRHDWLRRVEAARGA